MKKIIVLVLAVSVLSLFCFIKYDYDAGKNKVKQNIVEQINQEFDEAIEACEKEKYAEPEEAYRDVYSDAFPVRQLEF